MKKVGVLTFFRPINHGAIYQSYALSNIVLKKYNVDVQLIDYRLEKTEYYRKIFHFKYYKLNKNSLRSLLIDLFLSPRRFIKRVGFDYFIKTYLNTTAPCFCLYDIEELSKSFDYIIVGSDLVWNPEMTDGINPVYYLQFGDAHFNKISYAASIGLKSLEIDSLKLIGKYLDTFDYISVREKSAEQLISSYTINSISTVLDPTLLTDKNDWLYCMKKPLYIRRKKYLLVYMLEMSDVLISKAVKIAETLNLDILTYGSKKYFGNKAVNISTVSPDVFLYYLSESEAIITNSFHGCAFSILFQKQFWCIPHTTRGTRMIELLKELDLSDRLIIDNCDQISFSEIDFQQVNDKLNRLKDESFRFLDKAMGNIHE